MRTLASIVKINNIYKHDNADLLDIAEIGGWQCVIKKGQFKINESAIYIEIDSILPINEHFEFLLQGKEPKLYDNIPGIRLQTKRIRGKLSQGLLMPISILSSIPENSDVTELLGIRKYEKPIQTCLFGEAKGNFPSFIPKTDLTRIQSLFHEFEEWKSKNYTWTVEEKIDGSSTTAFYDTQLNVCSRNLNLKETEENAFWQISRKFALEEKLQSLNVALQFETFGNKLNGNIYKRNDISGYFFYVYDLNSHKYLTPIERNDILTKLELPVVPIIHENFDISNQSIQDLLVMANGKSKVSNVDREGLVFRCNEDSTIRFKVISNNYLLKFD